MARKNTAPPPSPERPRLLKPRTTAADLIMRQIQAGEELLKFGNGWKPPERLKEERQIWSDYTRELLKAIFTTPEIPDEFATGFGGWDVDPRRFLQNEVRATEALLVRLRSIHSRVDLFEEGPNLSRIAIPESSAAAQETPPATREIFVVHGRDEAVKQTIARYLEKLELHPIILHEQADKGRTIIQKFEDHSYVGFAIVLLTPDDEGSLKGSGGLKPRARQNVILELGYFIGKLGRARVCALKSDCVEEPSDLHGVLYVPFDAGGAWRLTLARELKAAGIEIDMNRAL